MRMKTKDRALNFRADPPTVAALEALRRAYGGLTISEAIRRALLSTAQARGLVEVKRVKTS